MFRFLECLSCNKLYLWFLVLTEMASRVDLKVVLLGKEYGGKTSLVERYIHGKFNSSAPYQSVRLDIVAPLFSSR